tara:strand:+ start:2026 stop:2952 length:927 start_codon:yes stop_codon:yes gene_type:complete
MVNFFLSNDPNNLPAPLLTVANTALTINLKMVEPGDTITLTDINTGAFIERGYYRLSQIIGDYKTFTTIPAGDTQTITVLLEEIAGLDARTPGGASIIEGFAAMDSGSTIDFRTANVYPVQNRYIRLLESEFDTYYSPTMWVDLNMNLVDSDSGQYNSIPVSPAIQAGWYYKLQYRNASGNLVETEASQAGSGGGGTALSITGSSQVAVFNGVTIDATSATVDIVFFEVVSPTWSPSLVQIGDTGGLLEETGTNQFTYTFTINTTFDGNPNMLVSGSVNFEAPLNANPYDSNKTSIAAISGTLYVNFP